MQSVDAVEMVGYLAAGLVVSAFYARTMLPLRAAAIASNMAFILYGYQRGLAPVLLLHAILLPLNVQRLLELCRVLSRVTQAEDRSGLTRALLPLMARSTIKAGQLLFQRGEVASRLYCVVEGTLAVREVDLRLGSGDLLGASGLFADPPRRLTTVVAETDAELGFLTRERLLDLCARDPTLAVALSRHIVGRLAAHEAPSATRHEPGARSEAETLVSLCAAERHPSA